MDNSTMTDMDETADPLCCCEYINVKGERSHLLAVFCECEDLDESCDRLFQGQNLDPSRVSAVRETVLDRLRIPMFLGQGARRIDDLMDTTALPPLFAIPLWLYLASCHAAFTLLSFLIVPASAIMYYLRVLKKRQRTQFFVSVTLVSIFCMYFVFSTYAVPLGDISSFEHAALTINLLLFLASFGLAKRGPGFVCRSRPPPTREKPYGQHATSEAVSNSTHKLSLHRRNNGSAGLSDSGEADPARNPVIGREVIGGSESTNDEQERRHEEPWCDACQMVVPQRAGHCKICGRCVHCLDHHCVWIDCCVGRDNHRAFIISLLLFFMGGTYGAMRAANIIYGRVHHMSGMWTALDVLFSEEGYAIMLVSVLYACFACPSVLALLVQQFHLITHNWTYRERKRAARTPGGREYLAGLDGGFFANWGSFINGRREWDGRVNSSPAVV